MGGVKTVIQLVQSLTKAEKRHFRIFCGTSEGNMGYLRLYNLINAFKDSDEMLIESCKKQYPGPELNMQANYLYSVIMKSLVSLHQQDGTEEKLLSGIQEIRLLFKKGFPVEGFLLLDKLRKLAIKSEKFAYCILLDKLQLQYLNRYQFQDISEEELLRLQTQLRKHLQYELNLTDHASLYELLNYRFLMQGSARSQKDKEKLNDLIFTEMNLAGNPRFQSFDLKKNHLLFQSVYFMMTGDHKSSLTTFFELNKLFENHRSLWTEAPIYYIQHVRGILNNLHLTGQYAEMVFFTEKLEELQKTHPLPILQQTIFMSKLKRLLGNKDYSGAMACIENNTDLLAGIQQFNPGDKAETLLFTSIAYLNNKDYKHAARLLRQVINLEYLPNRQLFRMLRLINLIVHFELHDFNYLVSGIRSLEREMKQSKRSYSTENALLRMLKKYPLTLARNARKKLLEATLTELRILKEDPYERQLFHTFDSEDWLQRKLNPKLTDAASETIQDITN